MTEEELEKEAIKASDKKCVKGCSKYYRYGFQDGYITGAEPREKRIAELEDKLANADYQLEGRDIKIKELEEQIEKMKSCANCKNYSPTYGLCCYSLGDEDYDCRLRKWEIKEK